MKERVRKRRQSKALVRTSSPEGDKLIAELEAAMLQGPDPEEFPVPTLQSDGTTSLPTLAAQVRTLAGRKSKETMPFVYRALWRFKMAGMTDAAIADQFGVSESSIDKYSNKARKWMLEHYSDQLATGEFAGRATGHAQDVSRTRVG